MRILQIEPGFSTNHSNYASVHLYVLVKAPILGSAHVEMCYDQGAEDELHIRAINLDEAKGKLDSNARTLVKTGEYVLLEVEGSTGDWELEDGNVGHALGLALTGLEKYILPKNAAVKLGGVDVGVDEPPERVKAMIKGVRQSTRDWLAQMRKGEPKAVVTEQSTAPLLRIRDRVLLDSSLIKSVGYDEPAQLLEIELQGGWVYLYKTVPRQEYDRLLNAPSHGSYYGRYIKGKYPSEKVGQITQASPAPPRASAPPTGPTAPVAGVPPRAAAGPSAPVTLHKYREVLATIPLRVKRLKLPQLKQILKAEKLRGYSQLKKEELGDFVLKALPEEKVGELLVPYERETLQEFYQKGLTYAEEREGVTLRVEVSAEEIKGVFKWPLGPGNWEFPDTICIIRDYKTPEIAYSCSCAEATGKANFCPHLWATLVKSMRQGVSQTEWQGPPFPPKGRI